MRKVYVKKPFFKLTESFLNLYSDFTKLFNIIVNTVIPFNTINAS